jgi:hypothetical protein
MHEHPSLPCYPCPHLSSCCAYGVTLSDDEAAAIARAHGASVVYRTRWGEWRTRVRGRRCVFPWTDAETGGPYEYDRTICPEFLVRPELVQLGLPSRPSHSLNGDM